MGDNLKHQIAMVKRLKRQLKELETRRKAVTDAIRSQEALIRLDGGDLNGAQTSREGSVATAATQALSAKGEPMRVPDLIAAMQAAGWEQDKEANKVRATLVSTLRRRTDIFNSPERGVYGLRAWDEEGDEPMNDSMTMK